jgi:hypothetical protein
VIGGGNRRILGKLPTYPTSFFFFLIVGILLISSLASAADILPSQGCDESRDSIPQEGQDKGGMTLLDYSMNILLIAAVMLVWVASVHVFNKYVI